MRQGLHFALAAQAEVFATSDVGSAGTSGAGGGVSIGPGSLALTTAGQPVGNGDPLPPGVSAGAFFASKLGLAPGRRLRRIDRASDVRLLLENRSVLSQPKALSVLALRNNLLLVGSAATNFRKAVVKDMGAWSLLKAKGYLNLQESLRTGASRVPEGLQMSATVCDPVQLPPLPLSRRATLVPAVAPVQATGRDRGRAHDSTPPVHLPFQAPSGPAFAAAPPQAARLQQSHINGAPLSVSPAVGPPALPGQLSSASPAPLQSLPLPGMALTTFAAGGEHGEGPAAAPLHPAHETVVAAKPAAKSSTERGREFRKRKKEEREEAKKEKLRRVGNLSNCP